MCISPSYLLSTLSMAVLVIMTPKFSLAQSEDTFLDKTPSNKSKFTLLDPTPKELMREMITDRPDTTEAPYTVDAGHFQFELSLFSGSYNKDKGIDQESFGILPSNIKVGVLNDVDIQFVFTPFERFKEKTNDERKTIEGFSDDTQVRVKVNLWGNDGGETALALMPYIKAPTGSGELSNDHVEGGVIIPLAISLSSDFSLCLMAEADLVYDEERDTYESDFVHTATVGHSIIGNLGYYTEYIGIAPKDLHGNYQAKASGGLTYSLTENWILDAGGTLGLSRDTEDVTFFMGTSFRL